MRAERVEVGAGVGRTTEGLLWRHVGHRAHHHALDREARTVDGVREAEVAELGGAVVREPDVAWFHVAVNDAARVRVLERTTDVVRDAQRLVERQPPVIDAPQEIGDRASRDELAHDIDPPLSLPTS